MSMINQSLWNTLGELTDPRMEPSPALREPPATTPNLVRGLGIIFQIGDTESRVRAIRALGAIQDREAVGYIVDALSDNNAHVRDVAVESLIRQGSFAVPVLIDAIQQTSSSARTNAIYRDIERLLPAETSASLFETLRAEQDLTRQAMFLALTQIGHPSAIALYEAGLDDLDPRIRRYCATALITLGADSIPLLLAALDDDVEFRQHIAESLIAQGGQLDEATQAMLYTASRVGRTPVRWVADFVLSHVADGSMAHSLDHALSDPDPEVRLIAIRSVRLVTETNIERILNAVRDTSPTIRLAAVELLAGVSDPRARGALVQAANDEDIDVRQFALGMVGTMSDIVEVEPLIQALTNRDTSLRRTAADVLASMPVGKVVPALIAALKTDPYGDIARTLGRLSDPSAVEPLLARLEGATYVFRQACIEALGALADLRALPAFMKAMDDDTAAVREAAIAGLDRLHAPSSIGRVVEALNDASPAVREKAALALEHMGPLVIQALLPSLESPDWRIRLNTVQVLGRIGDVRVVEILIRKLHDPAGNVCGAVINELKRLVDARAIGWLLKALEDREPFVRENAADLLTQLGDSFSLPRHVLGEARMSPRERAAILDYMRKVRYSDRHITFRFTAIGDVVSYCRQLVNDTNPDVQQGARAILAYIDQLRAAQPAVASA